MKVALAGRWNLVHKHSETTYSMLFMKRLTFFAGTCFLITAVGHGAPAAGQNADIAQIYPKNLARQHVGTNVFLYDDAKKSYLPNEAAAAWLDDDIATGWPAATGHHYYMVALAQPELLTNFELSTRGTAGTVSVYGGDESAPPSAKSWTPLAKDLPIESVNQKALSKSFSRFAKYVLIETNLTEAGPWYSLYLYGEKPADGYSVQARSTRFDAQSVYRFINDQGSINLSSLYSRSRVTYANSSEAPAALQKAIDDNPETAVTLASSDKESGMIVRFPEARDIRRISALADPGAKGRLDFYLMNSVAGAAEASKQDSQSLRAEPAAQNSMVAKPISIADAKPAGSITLDGTNPRGSIDFGSVKSAVMLVTWTPNTPGQTLAVREVNAFGYQGVSNADVSTQSDEAALSGYDASKDGKEVLGGKEVLDPKEAMPPVGEFLAAKTAFVPGPPPFPPTLPVSAEDPDGR